MAYVRYIPATEAGPLLSTLYQRYADARGNLDNILRVRVELEEGWEKEDCTLTREEFEVLREAWRREREAGPGT